MIYSSRHTLLLTTCSCLSSRSYTVLVQYFIVYSVLYCVALILEFISSTSADHLITVKLLSEYCTVAATTLTMASGEYSDLPDLNLSGVEEVMGADSEPKVIGCGSYAEVLELRFHGLKCAGKRFHKILYNETKSSNKLARSSLEESVFRERRFLATVRHPHIVQFLGVYMSKHSNLPVLVMEYLHTTLNECIEKYHILPETVAYTILEDIALALCYLHSKFIAHRDLSSNNILLTVDMHAKISDLGMAKILNITPKQKAMTTKPGTLYCMPPEVLINNPTYKVEIDIFSYGILAMEIFCGESPVPTNEFEEDSTCSGDHRFRRLTEIARRQKYMDVINPDHPMVGLIEQCLDEADKRPIAADVKAYIRQEKAKLNIDCYSKIEMLQERRCQKKKIEKLTNEQRRLTDEITDFKFTVTDLKQEIEVYKSEPSIDKLREEIETLRKDLNSTRDMLRKRESEVSEKTKHLLNRGEKYHERMHELEKQRSDAMKSLVSGEQVNGSLKSTRTLKYLYVRVSSSVLCKLTYPLFFTILYTTCTKVFPCSSIYYTTKSCYEYRKSGIHQSPSKQWKYMLQ